jgi:hypothetical protein
MNMSHETGTEGQEVDARDRKLRDAAIYQAHAAGWDPSFGAEPSMLDDGRWTRVAWRILVRRQDAVPWSGSPPLGPDDEGAWCREPVRRVRDEARPPVGLVLRNRLRALWCWATFVFARLGRGRNPFACTYALPSVGRDGPWTRPSPLAFGCEGDPQAHRALPFGFGATCDELSAPARPIRRLLAGSRYTPRPDGNVVVRAMRNGWVARSRFEPELYAPQDDGWAERAGVSRA